MLTLVDVAQVGRGGARRDGRIVGGGVLRRPEGQTVSLFLPYARVHITRDVRRSLGLLPVANWLRHVGWLLLYGAERSSVRGGVTIDRRLARVTGCVCWKSTAFANDEQAAGSVG